MLDKNLIELERRIVKSVFALSNAFEWLQEGIFHNGHYEEKLPSKSIIYEICFTWFLREYMVKIANTALIEQMDVSIVNELESR